MQPSVIIAELRSVNRITALLGAIGLILLVTGIVWINAGDEVINAAGRPTAAAQAVVWGLGLLVFALLSFRRAPRYYQKLLQIRSRGRGVPMRMTIEQKRKMNRQGVNYYAVLKGPDGRIHRLNLATSALNQAPFRHLKAPGLFPGADRKTDWPEPVTVYGLGRSGPLVIEAGGALLWATSDIGI